MLDGRALEADAHAIGFAGFAIFGFDEGLAATGAEIVVLRAPHDADGAAAIVESGAELALVRRRRLVGGERQRIACRELASLEAADAGARIGRQAAHEVWQGEAARDGEVGGARTLAHADAPLLAALQPMAAIGLHRL